MLRKKNSLELTTNEIRFVVVENLRTQFWVIVQDKTLVDVLSNEEMYIVDGEVAGCRA